MDRPKPKPPFFRPKPTPQKASLPSSTFPSSDPFEPLPPSSTRARSQTPRILAVEIQPNVLRPVAFRIFTKKHNLTLKSDALALLCTFVGRRCGADWRDSGAGEKLLDEIARQWRRNEGAAGVLVDGGEALRGVLRGLEVPGAGGGGGGELLAGGGMGWDLGAGVPSSALYDGGIVERMEVEVERGGERELDPKCFLKVVDAFEMPKWTYNTVKRGFEKAPKPSLLPPPSSKTSLFRTRHALLHQRLLRTDLFLPPTFAPTTTTATSKTHKITPIANLLGRAGQSFLLFGLLHINPSGLLTLLDPTGEIPLDLSIASAIPPDGSWFTPGSFCIADGAFEEDGRFTVYTIGQPLPERRDASAEVFGHVDFLGSGVTLDMGGQQGRAMRKAEKEGGGGVMVFCGEVGLDKRATLSALRAVLSEYADEPPLVVGLFGNFTSVAMGVGGRSVAYKEYFDNLASLLTEFPTLTSFTTFIFIPGDNDPWASTFSGGSSTMLPRRGIPDIFTTRIKRVFQQQQQQGEAKWMSNPCRISYFTQELVLCRDDVVGRLRRNAVNFKKTDDDDDGDGDGDEDADRDAMDSEPQSPLEMQTQAENKPDTTADTAAEEAAETHNARKLVKTLLDQGTLSPFSLSTRPVLWDHWHTLQLYPLPNALVLCEPTMPPFAVTYEGCHVMNPGALVERRTARWVEYETATGRGRGREAGF